MTQLQAGLKAELQAAWLLREKLGVFSSSDAIRVFHGPGEGSGALLGIAIERFGEHYWITEWEKCPKLEIVADFLRSHGARSAVRLFRPPKGVPANPDVLFGEPPQGRFSIRESGAIYRVQFLGTKHPGLFLDHAPLREWLLAGGARGLSVLNSFAYTGSLSVAAGLGGASRVTTLGLSKPAIEWARENWQSNGLPAGRGEFIFGDYFEWMQRLEKKKRLFDCVIVDPPSFSRGKKGSFSTSKDLEKLHELAFGILSPGGLLVTSINSAGVTRKKYFYDVHSAARSRSRKIEIIHEIELPATFPIRPGAESGPGSGPEADRYLKGWILRSV